MQNVIAYMHYHLEHYSYTHIFFRTSANSAKITFLNQVIQAFIIFPFHILDNDKFSCIMNPAALIIYLQKS